MNSKPISGNEQTLFADVGGTNARFALMKGGAIGPVEHIRVADFSTSMAAMGAFLNRHDADGPVTGAVLGIAGTIENQRSVITNSGWIIEAAEIRKTFGLRSAHLLNDFEALAWSLPALGSQDLVSLGEQRPIRGAPMLVVGPGTGFGASCFYPRDMTPLAVVGEAGHTTLPAACEREDRVIDHLRQRFGHASVERALSGAGLQNIYEALVAIEGGKAPERDPAAITQAALDGSCGSSRAALAMFCSFLGTVAGNLALTFCATGGVYVAGGIVPRFSDFFARSDFRARFESKGRYAPYLRKIPTGIIVRPDATFLGLKAFFDRMVAGA
jgi:glucokinase